VTTVAVLPVKRFGDAKQRLGETLATGRRRALTEAMVSDVLTALRRAQGIEAVVVVTDEHSAEALAHAHEAHAIGEPPEPGHSAAALRGVAWALERGASRALVVPGDCPTLVAREIDELLASAPPAPSVVVVPDRHGSGTNALLLSPPDAIEPSFGPGSRARHEDAARAAGAECRIAEPPGLLLDVDTAEDLETLAAALAASTGGAAHTRGLLVRLGRL
jgi:2-phospho-L-lactate guanylyltransferase